MGNNPGRPPKPGNLKLLHGDKPSRVNTQEPKPDLEVPIAPPYLLRPAVQEVWDRLAPERIQKKLLTSWDVDAFAAFCEAIVLAQKGAVEAHGEVIPGAPSPMSRFKDAINLCSTLGGRFGWTPSDRQKLIVGEAPREPGADLLSG